MVKGRLEYFLQPGVGIRDLLARKELGDVLLTFAKACASGAGMQDVTIFEQLQKLNSLKPRSADIEPDYDAHVGVLQQLNTDGEASELCARMERVDALRPLIYHLNWVLAQENADMAVRSEIEAYLINRLFGELLLGVGTQNVAVKESLRVHVATFLVKEVVMQLRRNFKSYHTNVINSSARILRGVFGRVSTSELVTATPSVAEDVEGAKVALWSKYLDALLNSGRLGEGEGADGVAEGDAPMMSAEERKESIEVFRSSTAAPANAVMVTLYLDWMRAREDAKRALHNQVMDKAKAVQEAEAIFEEGESEVAMTPPRAKQGPKIHHVFDSSPDTPKSPVDNDADAMEVDETVKELAPINIMTGASEEELEAFLRARDLMSFESFLLSRMELVQLPEDSKGKFSLEMRARTLFQTSSVSGLTDNEGDFEEHTSLFSLLHLDLAAAFLPHNPKTGKALKVDADEDLFEGLIHMQKARRGRALNRLADAVCPVTTSSSESEKESTYGVCPLTRASLVHLVFPLAVRAILQRESNKSAYDVNFAQNGIKCLKS